MASTPVSIRFKNNDGFRESITHYYHFLFASLFPLAHYHLAHPTHKLRILTDVGPMKRFLCELPLNVVELLSERVQSGRGAISTEGAITLPGYDNFGQDLFEANDLILSQFRDEILLPVLTFLEQSIPPFLRESPSIRPILLIERKTEAYFGQAYAEKQPAFWTSGSQRRSIKNHVELRDALQREFSDDFASVSLEGTSIAYQYLLFSSARVVIAQHGGALSNVIFMRPSSSLSPMAAQVLEISPPWGRNDNHFRNIAAMRGVGYERVLQDGDHSEVAVGEVLRVVKELLRRSAPNNASSSSATSNEAEPD